MLPFNLIQYSVSYFWLKFYRYETNTYILYHKKIQREK